MEYIPFSHLFTFLFKNTIETFTLTLETAFELLLYQGSSFDKAHSSLFHLSVCLE